MKLFRKSLSPVLIIFAATAFFVANAAVASNVYNPYLEISIPGGIDIRMIFGGRDDKKSCEASADRITTSVLATCPTCKVQEKECLDSLNPEQLRMLSAEPLDVPSVRIPDGVMTYRASNPDDALAACIETSRQASNMICYPSNKARPIPAGYYTTASGLERLLERPTALLIFASLAVGLVLMLAAPKLKRISKLGLRVLSELPRDMKMLFMALVDFVLLPLALLTAIALRNLPNLPELTPLWWLFIAHPLLTILVFAKLGLYRAVIRHFEFHAAWHIFWGVSLSTLILAALMWGLQIETISWFVYPNYWLIALTLIGASRIAARYFLHKLEDQSGTRRMPVAIFGAGGAGVQLARSLQIGSDYAAVVFLDDDIQLQGTTVAGIPVVAPRDLPATVERLEIKQVFLAASTITRRRRRELFENIVQLNLRAKTVPSPSELLSGRARIEDVRDISIEELLARDTVVPDQRLLTVCVQGKTVMITGAGGSIGSELCRQVLQLGPRKLVLFDFSEFFLYQIEQELQTIAAGLPERVEIIAILGSVCDKHRVESVMKTYGVQTLYHAAAYKHVPIVERNVIEGVRNNAIGTWNTAAAAQAAGVETFILISTDKAVRPTNVMGASKRFAELILQGLASQSGKPRYCMVRFGNVLGSSGSVVPLFERQIMAGGPVTVTHPDVTRYFMTIPEAAQLVIQAGAMGQGGDVFVLDMGIPIKILDLAERMIHLSGHTIRGPANPDGNIEIMFTGLRPGEKLYEELLVDGEVTGTQHPLIMRTEESFLRWPEMLQRLRGLEEACDTYDFDKIFCLLENTIEGYVSASRTFGLASPTIIKPSSGRVHSGSS